MEKLKSFFKDKLISTALDVGTGTGDFIPVLNNALPGAKITGVDPNSISLNEAAKKHPQCIFREMAGEQLSFNDNSFDVVSISMALHHLPNVAKTLAEMLRVLKPNGWIVVNELFSDNLSPAQEAHKLYHHFRGVTHRLQGVSHNPTYKKQEILNVLSNSGIQIQLQFEFKKEGNPIQSPEELNVRIDKMKAMLNEIKAYPEYDSLKSKIDEFAIKAKKYGFKPATQVVVVGVQK